MLAAPLSRKNTIMAYTPTMEEINKALAEERKARDMLWSRLKKMTVPEIAATLPESTCEPHRDGSWTVKTRYKRRSKRIEKTIHYFRYELDNVYVVANQYEGPRVKRTKNKAR